MPLCAAAVASLGNLLELDNTILFTDITDALFKERGPLATGDETFLSIFSLTQSTHSQILGWITEKSLAISGLKTVATEKIEALLPLARFVVPISLKDAKAIFTSAHQITDEMDRTAVHQLKCLAILLERASHGMNEQARYAHSAMYYSIVTDAALRLADVEGFPWSVVSSSLAAFNLSAAFASLARWEDAGITDRNACLAPILLASLNEELMTEAEVAALLPLLERSEPELIKRILEGLARRAAPLHSKIADAIARDVVLNVSEHGAERIAQLWND